MGKICAGVSNSKSKQFRIEFFLIIHHPKSINISKKFHSNIVDSRYHDPQKHFEISILRHIRFVVLRKKFEQPNFSNDYVI